MNRENKLIELIIEKAKITSADNVIIKSNPDTSDLSLKIGSKIKKINGDFTF